MAKYSDCFSYHISISYCKREFYGTIRSWPTSGWRISAETHCISLKIPSHLSVGNSDMYTESGSQFPSSYIQCKVYQIWQPDSGGCKVSSREVGIARSAPEKFRSHAHSLIVLELYQSIDKFSIEISTKAVFLERAVPFSLSFLSTRSSPKGSSFAPCGSRIYPWTCHCRGGGGVCSGKQLRYAVAKDRSQVTIMCYVSNFCQLTHKVEPSRLLCWFCVFCSYLIFHVKNAITLRPPIALIQLALIGIIDLQYQILQRQDKWLSLCALMSGPFDHYRYTGVHKVAGK